MGTVTAAGDLVHVAGNRAQQLYQLHHAGHIQLDHIPVHRHFPQIRPQIYGPQEGHFPVNHLLFLRGHLCVEAHGPAFVLSHSAASLRWPLSAPAATGAGGT